MKFKQTMPTNLGNTPHAVDKSHHSWWPPFWNSLLDPRFPRRATRRPRISREQALFFCARVLRFEPASPRPPSECLRSPEKREKITFVFQATVQGYWGFCQKYCFREWNKKYLNLWSSSRQNLRRADRERLIFPLLMQQSLSRRLLHADHYYDCCLFVCFIQFRNECSRLQVNGGYQDSWGYYVWQVFGEDNLGPSLGLFL